MYKTGESIPQESVEDELVELIKYFTKSAKELEAESDLRSSKKKPTDEEKVVVSLPSIEPNETDVAKGKEIKEINDDFSPHSDIDYDFSYSEEVKKWNDEFFTTLRKFNESRLGIVHSMIFSLPSLVITVIIIMLMFVNANMLHEKINEKVIDCRL